LAEDFALIILDQVGGLFVERVFVFFGRGKRSVKNRGIVAGEQNGSPVVATDRLVKLKPGANGGVQFLAIEAAVEQLSHRTQ